MLRKNLTTLHGFKFTKTKQKNILVIQAGLPIMEMFFIAMFKSKSANVGLPNCLHLR